MFKDTQISGSGVSGSTAFLPHVQEEVPVRGGVSYYGYVGVLCFCHSETFIVMPQENLGRKQADNTGGKQADSTGGEWSSVCSLHANFIDVLSLKAKTEQSYLYSFFHLPMKSLALPAEALVINRRAVILTQAE